MHRKFINSIFQSFKFDIFISILFNHSNFDHQNSPINQLLRATKTHWPPLPMEMLARPLRREEIQRRVEGIKKEVWDSVEEEKKWIKENYDRPSCQEELYDLPIPPMLYLRCTDLVYKGRTYFQVQKQSEDDLFLNRIDKQQSTLKFSPSMQSTIYDQLAIIIAQPSASPWEILRKLSDAANDYRFYDSSIRAAATLASHLYTTEELIRAGHGRLHVIELNKLWKMFSIPNGKGPVIDEFCKTVVDNKIDKDEYSLVMETDLYFMFNSYEELLSNPKLLDRSYETFISAENKTTPMLDKFKEVISNMKLSTRSKVEADEYTRFLITFARQNTMEVIHNLRDEHMKVIDKEGLHALDPKLLAISDEPSSDDILFYLEMILDSLATWRRNLVRNQLRIAVLALRAVVGYSLVVANEVLEIIEVAELRRIVLGSRFINRNHLIWAFYECGFGLPLEIIQSLDLPIAEDHPPYVIYLASRELATSLGFEVGYAGEKKLHLEHFVFSVLYAEQIIVDKNQVTEIEEQFKTFMEVVALDGIKRPKLIGTNHG